MKRMITILAVIPILMSLSQCILMPFSVGFVDGNVWDAVDGYPVANVYVEIIGHRGCSDCRCSGSCGPVVLATCYTDCEGYFGSEFSWRGDYCYKVVLSHRGYFTASRSLGCSDDHYIEVALEPAW